MEVTMLQMDDLVSIIQAMKTEIRMLKERNLQHEEYIKKLEIELAVALEAKTAAEAKASFAEKTAAALVAATATNELNATKVEPDDPNQQQQLATAPTDSILQGQSHDAADKNGELKSELLITDVSKDESGINGYVINVCVTNQNGSEESSEHIVANVDSKISDVEILNEETRNMTPVLIEMTPTHQSENQIQQQQILPSSPESELEHQPNNNKKPIADPIMLPITVDSDDGDDGSSELVHVATKVTVEPNNKNADDIITPASNIWHSDPMYSDSQEGSQKLMSCSPTHLPETMAAIENRKEVAEKVDPSSVSTAAYSLYDIQPKPSANKRRADQETSKDVAANNISTPPAAKRPRGRPRKTPQNTPL